MYKAGRAWDSVASQMHIPMASILLTELINGKLFCTIAAIDAYIVQRKRKKDHGSKYL